MKTRGYAFLFFVWGLFLIPGLAFAVDLKVAENPVPENSFAEVTIVLAKGDKVSWDIYPEPTKVVERQDAVYFSGPRGTKYKVTATVVNFDTKTLDKKTEWVTLAGDYEPPLDVATNILTNSMKDKFKKEKEEEKLLAPKFAQLYQKYATQPYIEGQTWGGLFQDMSKDVADLKIGGKLLITQEVVQNYLMQHLPSKDAWNNKITGADLNKIKTVFSTVATAWTKMK